MQVTPYLTFPGTCEAAMRFYADIFGSTDLVIMTPRGTPMEADMPADRLDQVMHARLSLGPSSLMAADAPPDRYRPPAGFMVSIQLTDTDEAARVFTALAEGGLVIMPLEQTFWARRFGILTDRFATPWMINCE